MSARDDLRALAARLDGDTYLHDAPTQAAALRALADRIDSLERDVVDRQRALNNSVELGYLRIDHGEGEAQHRTITRLAEALARLDADLAPPEKEPRHE